MNDEQPELIPFIEGGTDLTPRELEMNDLYEKTYQSMKKDDAPLQTCPVCGESGSKDSMDRHHPAGRYGKNRVFYVYLCRPCHQKVHEDQTWAEEHGFLFPGRNRIQLSEREKAETMNKIIKFQQP